jgi:preprotein translocase subunit SecE
MAFINPLQKINSFFKEIVAEMKKVNWPTRKETVRDTLIVLGVSVTAAMFLGGVDFVVKNLLEKFIL